MRWLVNLSANQSSTLIIVLKCIKSSEKNNAYNKKCPSKSKWASTKWKFSFKCPTLCLSGTKRWEELILSYSVVSWKIMLDDVTREELILRGFFRCEMILLYKYRSMIQPYFEVKFTIQSIITIHLPKLRKKGRFHKCVSADYWVVDDQNTFR